MEVNRPRTQADRSAATKVALVRAARPLFADHGFAGVGTEAIANAAGVTRGAMYHQFADKTELFAAVFEAVEADAMSAVGDAIRAAGATDPLDVLEIGANAWLDACSDPEIQQIALIDAPAVLGWERWREVGMRYSLGLVEALLTDAIERGRTPAQPVTPLAHVFVAAVDEAALYVVRSAEPAQAREEMRAVIGRLITALAV
jgi:AcrR family transcriptional regulator